MAQDYLKILNSPEIVSWAKAKLQRSDRIVWYLKQVKSDPTLHPSLELEHYYAMKIPQITQFHNFSLSYDAVILEFKQLETAYLAKQQEKHRLIEIQETDEIFLSLENDYCWVKLPSFYCEAESQAMGHCGNSYGEEGQRLLSLRKRVKRGTKEFWEPHLTFVLTRSGFLGEMKGKQNAKPSLEYHPQILSLILSPKIQGLAGGGFLSENNFALQDLSENDLDLYVSSCPQKFLPLEKLAILNRDNAEYFLNLRPESQMQAEIAVSWIKDENLLFQIAQQNKRFYPSAAINQLRNPSMVVNLCSSLGKDLLPSFKLFLVNFNEEERSQLYEIAFKRKSFDLKIFLSRSAKNQAEQEEFLKRELLEDSPDNDVLNDLFKKLRRLHDLDVYNLMDELVKQTKPYKVEKLLNFVPQSGIVRMILSSNARERLKFYPYLTHIGQITSLLDMLEQAASLELQSEAVVNLFNSEHFFRILKYDVAELFTEVVIYPEKEQEVLELLKHPLVMRIVSQREREGFVKQMEEFKKDY